MAVCDPLQPAVPRRELNADPIPAENLVGKAQFIFFSTDGTAHWWEIWKWPFAIRYGRLFHGIG